MRKSILRLIREFSKEENKQKLKHYAQTSAEMESFKKTFSDLQELYEQKLSTPLEEVNSINENLKIMRTRVTKLKEIKESKQDAFDKYCEECAKSKEQRESHLKILKETKSIEQSKREETIMEAKEAAFEKEK